MSPEATSRRRNNEGEVMLVKVRNPELLVRLREGKPDKKGRPGQHLTQRQIAADLVISHGHYGDIEAGRRQPSLAVAERIARYHGLTLEDLFEEIPLEYDAPDGLDEIEGVLAAAVESGLPSTVDATQASV